MDQSPTASTANAAPPRVTYDRTPAMYASQFLVTAAEDQLLVDCSPGLMNDAERGDVVLPVHTRLALSYAGARRLVSVLTRAIQQHERQNESPEASDGRPNQSRLPKLGVRMG